MASAVNLTGTVNDDEGGPSIFELVSQHGFAHALRPAFSHIVKTLAERFPEGTIPFFYRHFDEVYLAFDSLVQWHYILTRGATLSEAFYGLQRSVSANDIKLRRLTRVRLSYVMTVLLPYVQVKLDKFYENQDQPEPVDSQAQTANIRESASSSSRLQLFLKGYPYIKAVIAITNFLLILSYSFGYTKSHNLMFRLLEMRLSYATPDRTKFVEEKKSEIFRPESWSLKKFPILLFRSLGESVLFGVEIGSFFVQFLDWWYNDPRRERVVLTSLPVPPPLSSEDQNYLGLRSEEKEKCPLCRKKFRNATALATSGVVYCYGCILPHLKQHGSCPLTSIKSNVGHLIRIFL